VTSREACAEWVRILRAVVVGKMTPAEALARRPDVADEDESAVPSAFWSARDLLEQEVEFSSESPDAQAHFHSVMNKLADRIEAHPKAKL
jgi:hypothetical protein